MPACQQTAWRSSRAGKEGWAAPAMPKALPTDPKPRHAPQAAAPHLLAGGGAGDAALWPHIAVGERGGIAVEAVQVLGAGMLHRVVLAHELVAHLRVRIHPHPNWLPTQVGHLCDTANASVAGQAYGAAAQAGRPMSVELIRVQLACSQLTSTWHLPGCSACATTCTLRAVVMCRTSSTPGAAACGAAATTHGTGGRRHSPPVQACRQARMPPSGR